MMITDVAHAMECVFFMSVELIQQIPAHIDGYTSCFYFLLWSYGYTHNGQQSTHYVIIVLNGYTCSSQWGDSMNLARAGMSQHMET